MLLFQAGKNNSLSIKMVSIKKNMLSLTM